MSGKVYRSEYGQMAAIMDCMADGVIAVDAKGLINYMNSSAEQITGWRQEEAIGAGFYKVFPLIDEETKRALPSPLVLISEASGPVDLLPGTMLICRDGSCKYISASCAIVRDARGKATGAVTVFRDVTHRKRAEEQLRKAKEKAEAANRAKSEFLANISHEIRTPVNGILGMIELTLLTDLTKEQRNNLLTAKNCVDSLLLIIKDILDFSKMEAGKMIIEHISFDLQDLVDEIIRTNAVAAQKKNLQLELIYGSDIPRVISCDPNRLRQIINNLLNNAIKFTEKGSVTLSVQKMFAKKEQEREWLLFSVKDTGIGIARENMGKLFKSFTQIDSSPTRKFGGTGLGLVICKKLVVQQGGKMWVTSELQKGSTFSFTLPLIPGKEPKRQPKRMTKFTKTSHPLKILLVEDDNVNRLVMSQLLKKKGHLVDLATNGREAVDMHDKNVYDAILMDIQMPEMDGIEATAIIREREGTLSRTPVIALTAYSLQGDRARFISLGMDEYISKPVAMEDLYALLEKITEKKSKNVAAESNKAVDTGDGGGFIAENRDYYGSLKPLLQGVGKKLQQLQAAAEAGNLAETEEYAHLLKNAFIAIDAEELKYSAFRIELAARRGDFKTARDLIKHILQELTTFKKGF